MGKKKKDRVGIVVSEDGQFRVEDQETTLARSLVMGASLLDENERLEGELAEAVERFRVLSNTHRHCLASDSYWRNRRRRFIGAWNVGVRIELAPWAWQWRPYWFRSAGVVEVAWLFLKIEALER